jgi:hypothetical protein
MELGTQKIELPTSVSIYIQHWVGVYEFRKKHCSMVKEYSPISYTPKQPDFIL